MIRLANYKENFKNYIAGKKYDYDVLKEGRGFDTNFLLPTSINEKADKTLADNNIFRRYGTIMPLSAGAGTIYIVKENGKAKFVAEEDLLPTDSDSEERIKIVIHKVGSIAKLNENFIHDAGFDVENYISTKFAKRFAKAEEDAIINGSGDNEPKGILNYDIGKTESSLSYDSLVSLYFSLNKDYRDDAIFVMSDETMMRVRLITDSNGRPIFDISTNTIFGKKVEVTNNIADGTVLFGDFSYLWFVIRKSLAVSVLEEIYAVNGNIGYKGTEYVDAHLTDVNAVKALVIHTEE